MDAIIRAYNEHGCFCGITEVDVEDRTDLANEMKDFAKKRKCAKSLVGMTDLFTMHYDVKKHEFIYN